MKLQFLFCYTFVVFFSFDFFGQSLILNEVSQGPSGSKEYVELLVIPGITPFTCSNYCLDLRGWILDDNNGYFSGGPTSGVGIANGAVRFKNDPFWQCIPIGTLIVVYNDLDPNVSLPANDNSIVDGNCRIILPVSSSLFEHQTTSPTTTTSNYPGAGWITGGSWGPISMANGGDAFQVYNPTNLVTPAHGVSWANNNVNPIIYFAGSATNSVYYFANTIDNNPSNQSNWVAGTCTVPNNQTPGLPNNAANSAYISSLNNNCAGPLIVTLTSSIDASNCLCNGEATVNADGSIPGYTYAWYDASFISIGQNTFNATNLCAGTYSCIVSSSINCTDTILVTINNSAATITPTFNPIAPICAGGTINLPTTSLNGISGLWSPAVDNTQTTTYTFTPTAGQCAATTTLQVSVGAQQTPTFAPVGPYCSGASFSLPTSSIEGFTGSWSPAIVSTATTNYNFTPTVGQCATSVNLTVTINPIPTVTILENPTICAGQSTVLTTSTSIPGGSFAWTPGGETTPTITVNSATTASYSVIYTVSGCASLASNSIVTVNSIVTPTFNPIAPICAGGTINLPTTSLNGISGLWSPAVDNTQTTSYTFTPTAGQCAATTTLQVSVGAQQTPTFAPVGPYCSGASFSLPISSIEGFTGSWSPAIVSTATTNYNFTPAVGQCATSANLSVTINPIPTVTILENPTICAGQSTVLTTSTSIPGGSFAWSPGQTTPTISVNPATTTNYSVIYTVSGCASSASNSIVTVNSIVTPTFNPIAPICAGGTINLPTTSLNGISGLWSPAVDNTQTTSYTFTPTAGQCAATTTLQVSVGAPQTPSFAPVGPYCSGASFSLPISSIEGFTGSWSPAIVSTATTNYTFTPTVGQCATTTNLSVTINPIPTVTILENPTICAGQTTVLTTSTSIPGGSFAWTPGQTTPTITVNPATTTSYSVIYTLNGCSSLASNSIVTVNSIVTPTFNPIAPICAGGTINLPTTSLNGISGLWSPAVDNTQTTTYTFTPTAGQCAATTTLQVSVGAQQTPTFAPVGPYCSGASFSLPISSIEGFTGSWSPAIVSTATTNYNFTPTVGQCATSVNLTVTINPIPTVTILENPTICAGQTTVLTTSTSIPGGSFAWTPGQTTPTITVNPATTTSYSVIYTVSGCASSASNSIVTVNSIVTPTFNPIAPICAGGTINLPTTSLNGISGLWSPAVDNTQTTTYTFTPTAGQCAATTTLQVSVGAQQTPTFAPVGPYCSGASFSLPTSSIEGFTGSWLPAIITTATTNYTFTPAAGQCATSANLSVTINPIPTVTILENPTICAGQSTVLTTSTSIPGGSFAWSPGQTTPTITVNPATTTSYSVIYTVSGCASSASNSIVTVNSIVTPTFNPIAPICAGGTINLPTTSLNGISGLWSPAVDNTQTTTYTFTPTAGQCAATTTLQVSVGAQQTPTFAPVGPYCSGASFSLPISSIEGFTGSWLPAIITTATTNYTFTPAAGQCATTTNLSVTINPIPTVTILENPTICAGQNTVLTTSTSIPGGSFAWTSGQTTPTISINPATTTNYSVVYTLNGCSSLASNSLVTVSNSISPQFAPWGPYCQNDVLVQVILPQTSINGITGTWNPQMVSTANAGISTYTFTPTAGQCASVFQLQVETFATPIINAGADLTICNGNSVTLTATGGIQYTWSNSVQNGIPFQAAISSEYSVSATDANGCEGFDTVLVTVLPSPNAAFTPDITSGIAPLSVQFTNTSTNATSYVWNFGNGNTLAVSNTNTVSSTYLTAQSYTVWLVASNGFCADSALTTIIVLPAGAPEIVIPNVFTPNEDNTNDEWTIQTTNIASIEIVILNRWGNVMAQITDIATGWDGKTTNGDVATDGTYFYKYSAQALNGENLSGHGFLMLLR